MPAPTRSPDAAKIQRWLDVIAVLLRRAPDRLTFAELSGQVPEYARGLKAKGTKRLQELAVSRMWERDKDELRRLGVPIETDIDETGSFRRYRLDAKEFYLPFVQCAGLAVPRRKAVAVSLDTVVFTPEELTAVQRAARRAMQLGDPALADAAQRAVASVAHDVATLDPTNDAGETVVASALDPAVLRQVSDALVRGRRVRCTYRSMHRNTTVERVLEPLGLVFQLGHWYMVARDPDDARVKTFRASRLSHVTSLAPSNVVTPPRGFSLATHAASRAAWELGDGEATAVRLSAAMHVPLDMMPGAVTVRGRATPTRRQVTMPVRRLEPFLRWVLAFGGDVRPVAPASVVAEFRALVARTAQTYEGRA
jgi:proteasome accessory factor B